MKKYTEKSHLILAAFLFLFFSCISNAQILFFPLPNLSKPDPLQKIIDALEKSDETKAVAYASEDKTFGSKNWVWGHIAGAMSQEEANKTALMTCEAGLNRAKSEQAGGKPIYDFGKKQCELHKFKNITLKLSADGSSKISSGDSYSKSQKIISKSKEFPLPAGWTDEVLTDQLKANGWHR